MKTTTRVRALSCARGARALWGVGHAVLAPSPPRGAHGGGPPLRRLALFAAHRAWHPGLRKDAAFGIPLASHLEATSRSIPLIVEKCIAFVETRVRARDRTWPWLARFSSPSSVLMGVPHRHPARVGAGRGTFPPPLQGLDPEGVYRLSGRLSKVRSRM